MVVDDHSLVVEMLVGVLSRDPSLLVVGTAATATDAIALVLERSPDIVIMDLVLPDMDGASATRAMLAQRQDLKVIMLTGSDRPSAYHVAMDAGCRGWVRKTAGLRDLLETVRRVAAGEVVTGGGEEDQPPLPQLALHYQPIVDLRTRRVVGFESLVRWQHPHRGLLLPFEFLPLAEETGYIGDISRWVLRVAAKQVVDWQGRHPMEPPVYATVNLSANVISHPDLIVWMSELLESTPIDAGSLVVEVTETTFLDDSDQTLRNLQTLKRIGFHIALDDFGTAFSSLAYLRRFPFDVIKIDKSFTAELPHSPRAVLLIESISHVAEAFDLTAIAEGIERPSQARCLLEAGWRYGQGFLYSRPLPADAAEALLRPVRDVRRRARRGGDPITPA